MVTPSKIVTSNMASIQHEQLVESRKRSDIDFDAFSDVKRRKSEKGGKGTNYLFCLSKLFPKAKHCILRPIVMICPSGSFENLCPKPSLFFFLGYTFPV